MNPYPENQAKKAAIVLALSLLLLAGPVSAASAEEALSIESKDSDLSIPNLIKALNEDRLKNGIAPLRRDTDLDRAAAMKATDMVQSQYFSHSSPDGTTPWFWFKSVGYDYTYAGENLALDFSDPLKAQAAWMASPTHRDNILNADYEDVGYAIAEGVFTNINGANKTRRGVIIVQIFGKRSSSSNTFLSARQLTEPLDSPASGTAVKQAITLGQSIVETVNMATKKVFTFDKKELRDSARLAEVTDVEYKTFPTASFTE